MINIAIYVFTCNNCMKLQKIINELCSLVNIYDIVIIDDSDKFDIIKANVNLTKMFDLTYLGKDEFIKFYNLKKEIINSKQCLGDETWNLGIARNFALDYSLRNKYEKVLFVDDDISEIDSKILSEGFSLLDGNNFVSCNLIGTEDNSIIGHISKNLGIIDEFSRMLSGGFLFLTPSSINNSFLNLYNEDWIIQFLEKDKLRITMPFSVKHNATNDINSRIDQINFQEIGELIIEGLNRDENALSLDSSFWDSIIKFRIKYIQTIKEMAQQANAEHYYDICNHLQIWLKQLDGQTILKTIKQNKYEQEDYKI